MATTPTPRRGTRPPLPPPGPSNIFIMTPYPFAPSKRELREHEEKRQRLERELLGRSEDQRDARRSGQADALDK